MPYLPAGALTVVVTEEVSLWEYVTPSLKEMLADAKITLASTLWLELIEKPIVLDVDVVSDSDAEEAFWL
jgi:hypothetical protein